MAAIKRSPQLQPLSRDHHTALMVAQRVGHGLEGRAFAGDLADFDGLLNEALEFRDSHLLAHIAAEEQHLVPALRAAEPDREPDLQRLIDEHARLRSSLEAAADRTLDAEERREALRAFAALLETHVRFEERMLFDVIETAVPVDVLDAIGAALADYEAERERACRIKGGA